MRKRSGSGRRRKAPFDWRAYQLALQRGQASRRFRRLRGLLVAALVAIGLCGIYSLLRGSAVPSASRCSGGQRAGVAALSKTELRSLLDRRDFNNLTTKNLCLHSARGELQVETSLDVGLQKYLLSRFDRKNSRAIGIVVMEPETGRVLAMAGFDRAAPAVNPCLRSAFPSASVFKIVTAASAVDHCGLTAGSPMHFCGGKYTLYKRQLRDLRGRPSTTVSLQQAFAQSIDPVFGKIGERRLGGALLMGSAAAFGFNTSIDFDLPTQKSRFRIDERPYHLAELASGFNRETTISPLHGAMMVSAVLDDGRLVEPSIVDRIVGGRGRVLYRLKPTWMQQAMSPKASAVLQRMMQATIASGTCRRIFRGYRRDRVLSRLEIGGKTGTIDNRAHDTRYDWFVGFAQERHGGRQVVVAAMVAHGKYIGTRAGRYARMAFRYCFRQAPGGRDRSTLANRSPGVSTKGRGHLAGRLSGDSDALKVSLVTEHF